MEIIKRFEGGGSSAGTYLIKDREGRVAVMKYANWLGVGSNGTPWLKAQFSRLKELKESLPKAASNNIPEVYDFVENRGQAYYTLEYFEDGTPLSLYHFKHSENGTRAFLRDIDRLLTMLSEQFYSQGCLSVPEGYVEQTHLSRLDYRLGLLSKQEGEVYKKLIKNTRIKLVDKNCIDISKLFTKLASQEVIKINNRNFLNAPILLEIINSCDHLKARLKPSFLPKFAHGDALLRNFLRRENGNLVIFDVRGVDLPNNSPAKIDITYELGKILHGVFLEIVRNDLFEIKIKEEDGVFVFNLDYETSCKSVKNFMETREQLPSLFIGNHALTHVLRNEPRWLQKSLFAEATHFLADAINRLENDPTGIHTIAYYLIGTILLNSYMKSEEI